MSFGLDSLDTPDYNYLAIELLLDIIDLISDNSESLVYTFMKDGLGFVLVLQFQVCFIEEVEEFVKTNLHLLGKFSLPISHIVERFLGSSI